MERTQYRSFLAGSVRMSEEACRKLELALVMTNEGPVGVSEYLELTYCNGRVYVRGWCATPDDLYRAMVEEIARHKDVDDIDELDCTQYWNGVLDACGRYYVGRGRWCYVAGEVPPAPSEGGLCWQKVGLKGENKLELLGWCTEKALRELGPGSVDDAVDWGDLHCIDAFMCSEPDNERWVVIVAKTAPDACRLQFAVREKLAAMGFENVEVITEW
ncbi:hypothetical protein [Thermanaeromonas toyohensis]|uniref:hypothetical protein n=1 Tax=Thermanaeromonas toyohensis TaxID=161154 RepID=UPI0012F4A14C|nr:hypothetical protein [Thermanaeromonas toyohensis]